MQKYNSDQLLSQDPQFGNLCLKYKFKKNDNSQVLRKLNLSINTLIHNYKKSLWFHFILLLLI